MKIIMQDWRAATVRTLAILLAASSLSACIAFNDRHLDPLAASLDQQIPEISLNKEMAIGLGGGIMRLVDLGSAGNAGVSGIDHLRVAVFNVASVVPQPVFPDAVFQLALDAQGEDLTWERIVRVREAGEQLWIFAGMNVPLQRLESLAVFVLDHEELVLINIDGGLDALLRYALDTDAHRGRKTG